jgi:hypothetical protein
MTLLFKQLSVRAHAGRSEFKISDRIDQEPVRFNITAEELQGLRIIAGQLLGMTPGQLDEAVRDGSLQEICYEQQR